MIRRSITLAKVAVLSLALAGTGGCLAAAAGAGAAGGIYLTNQGAQGIVQGSMSSVAGRVPGVLSGMSVTVTGTSTDNNGAEREWHGTMGDNEVHVQLQTESASTTRVTASVKKSPVEWDKDAARNIVQRIVSSS